MSINENSVKEKISEKSALESIKIEIKNEETDNNHIMHSDKDKKEGELTCSLPLSLEISEMKNIKEQINEHSNFNNFQIPNVDSSKASQFGCSPNTPNKIHNLSFYYNNKERNLNIGNNFESPFRRYQNPSLFSPSPISYKITSSASINKHFIEIENQGYNYQGIPGSYSYLMDSAQNNNMILNNDPFNSSLFQQNNRKVIHPRNLNFNNKGISSFRPQSSNKFFEIFNELGDKKEKEILKNKENCIKIVKNDNWIKNLFEKKELCIPSCKNILKTQYQSESFRYHSDEKKHLSNHKRFTLNVINTNIIEPYSLYQEYNYDHGVYYINNRFNNNLPPEEIRGNNSFISNLNLLKEEREKNISFRDVKEEINGLNNSILVQPNQLNQLEKKLKCNCKKSKCLKLYCECFANETMCENCNCSDCHNLVEYLEERVETIKLIKEKNPLAFQSKINNQNNNSVKHSRGCNCNKSGCEKRYCECYQRGITCSDLCRCRECKNMKNSKTGEKRRNSISKDFNISEENTNQGIKLPSTHYTIENTSIYLGPPKENKKSQLINGIMNKQINLQKFISKPFSKIKSKSQLMKKKRKRVNTVKKRSSNRKSVASQNIVKLFNKIQPSKLDNIQIKSIDNQDTLNTPKKESKLSVIHKNIRNNNKTISTNNLSTKSNRIDTNNINKYKDLTLSNMITTASSTTKRRSTTTKLNVKDIDKSIVKKLNMNIN